MTPPFASGVEHVLKAWNLLYDGELVAILNAEVEVAFGLSPEKEPFQR